MTHINAKATPTNDTNYMIWMKEFNKWLTKYFYVISHKSIHYAPCKLAMCVAIPTS